MCIFSGEIERVAGTRIFARLEDGWQHLVYDMELASAADTAMLLPLPVVSGGSPDTLRFTSLEDYPGIFEDLEGAFPPNDGAMGRVVAASLEAPLPVQRVGAFEASYVPTAHDFGRLDPRFRLPADVLEALPGHRDDGFAVFKLRAGECRVHPMALRFRTREPGSLFYPTVHVHERRLEPWARFDHALYAQGRLAVNRDWITSLAPLGQGLRGDALGLVEPGSYGYRRLLFGVYENRDTRLALD